MYWCELIFSPELPCIDGVCAANLKRFWNGNAVFAVLMDKTPLCWMSAGVDGEIVSTS